MTMPASHDPPQPATADVVCADCVHCKVFKEVAPSGRYLLKIRCARNHWWRGRLDRVLATYDLYRLHQRHQPGCPDYDSISEDEADREQYLRDLFEDLPLERYVYEADGSFAELGERP